MNRDITNTARVLRTSLGGLFASAGSFILMFRRRIFIALIFILMSFLMINLSGCSKNICPAYKDTANKR